MGLKIKRKILEFLSGILECFSLLLFMNQSLVWLSHSGGRALASRSRGCKFELWSCPIRHKICINKYPLPSLGNKKANMASFQISSGHGIYQVCFVESDIY